MKSFFRILLVFALMLSTSAFNDVEGQSRKAERAKRKAERLKERQWNAVLKSQEKDKNRRLDMQTPETKKRMKESRKNSTRLNKQNHDPFLKKLFHRKKR